MAFDSRHNSRTLLDGPDRAPARSYFKAVGFSDEESETSFGGCIPLLD